MKKRAKQILKALLVIFWVGGGINHFVNPDFYLGIMPEYMPMHRELVYLSGVTEIIAGIMVAIPATTRYGVWFIYAHLLVFMTVHVYMIQYASTRFADSPFVQLLEKLYPNSYMTFWLGILWLRIPMQALLAYWAYWCTKPAEDAGRPDSQPEESVQAA